jgi:lysophosphatidylcholine acyltransferase/lyso-PAF acetyltransferase
MLLFGFGMFAIPFRLFCVFFNLFMYWAWLRLWTLLLDLSIVTQQTYDWFSRVIVRPGSRMILMFFGISWIKRHFVSDEEMRRMLVNIRGTAESDIEEKYKTKPPFVVISNHTCYMDPVICISELGECSIVARAGTDKSPIIGKLTQQLKCLFTGAGGVTKQIVQRASQYYDDPNEKTRLLIFPEATTTIGTHIIRFHDGCFVPGVPIQIMVLRFPYKTFNPCWSGMDDLRYLIHLFSQFVIPMEVIFFPPYYPTAEERKNPKLFAENVRRIMVEGANLKTKYLGPMELGNERYERLHEKNHHHGHHHHHTKHHSSHHHSQPSDHHHHLKKH